MSLYCRAQQWPEERVDVDLSRPTTPSSSYDLSTPLLSPEPFRTFVGLEEVTLLDLNGRASVPNTPSRTVNNSASSSSIWQSLKDHPYVEEDLNSTPSRHGSRASSVESSDQQVVNLEDINPFLVPTPPPLDTLFGTRAPDHSFASPRYGFTP